MFKFLERRRQREQDRRHQVWLDREESWWEFQLGIDFLADKISYAEMVAWRRRIKLGEKYVGWALKNSPE